MVVSFAYKVKCMPTNFSLKKYANDQEKMMLGWLLSKGFLHATFQEAKVKNLWFEKQRKRKEHRSIFASVGRFGREHRRFFGSPFSFEVVLKIMLELLFLSLNYLLQVLL